MKYPPVQYHDYLGLDKLLTAQHRKSEEYGKPAHDEMLFIIVHQAYELWFKQMLFELDSVMKVFSMPSIPEADLGKARARLERTNQIIRFITGQIDIIESMTPMDFLEFRDFLYPASGFQSYQFRIIETKLGLRVQDRILFQEGHFYKFLKKDQQKEIESVLDQKSLFDHIESWLERIPFLQAAGFNFQAEFKNAVTTMFQQDRATVNANPMMTEADRKKTLAMLDATEATFASLGDEKSYNELRAQGHFRFSYKALQAALLILLYRDLPVLQVPHQILRTLIEIDEALTNWRYRHALMAHRMLGQKIGTGGSSGHQYLKQATDQHKIYQDLFNLSTYLLPRSMRPKLPDQLIKQMEFHY